MELARKINELANELVVTSRDLQRVSVAVCSSLMGAMDMNWTCPLQASGMTNGILPNQRRARDNLTEISSHPSSDHTNKMIAVTRIIGMLLLSQNVTECGLQQSQAPHCACADKPTGPSEVISLHSQIISINTAARQWGGQFT